MNVKATCGEDGGPDNEDPRGDSHPPVGGEQAGELAEPYRFVVIADFPTNFNEEAVRRLSSIINSGARCGVHTLISYDSRQELPPGIDMEDLSSNSAHLVYENDRFVWYTGRPDYNGCGCLSARSTTIITFS